MSTLTERAFNADAPAHDRFVAAWRRKSQAMFDHTLDVVHHYLYGCPFPWGEAEWMETLEGTDVY